MSTTIDVANLQLGQLVVLRPIREPQFFVEGKYLGVRFGNLKKVVLEVTAHDSFSSVAWRIGKQYIFDMDTWQFDASAMAAPAAPVARKPCSCPRDQVIFGVGCTCGGY